MTDTYCVLPGSSGWRVLREGREIAAYPTRAEAVNVAGRLETAVLGGPSFAPKRVVRSAAGRTRSGG